MRMRASLFAPTFFIVQVGTAAAQAIPASARVVTVQLTSSVYGNTRSLRIYLPPRYHAEENAHRKYPVLFMADGFAVFSSRGWNAPAVLDSLVHAGAITPLVLVGIDNAASIPGIPSPSQARATEYLPYTDSLEPAITDPQGHRFPDMLWTEVMPLVQARFRIDDENVVVGGMSYGAIAALYTGAASGERIRALLLESPPVFMFEERLTTDLLNAKVVPDRIYVGIGTSETPDTVILQRGAAAIRRLVDTARGRGITTLLNEVPDARHESKAWRERLPRALLFLFPPTG